MLTQPRFGLYEEVVAGGRHLEGAVAPAVGTAIATWTDVTTSRRGELGKAGERTDPGGCDGAHRVQPQQRQTKGAHPRYLR